MKRLQKSKRSLFNFISSKCSTNQKIVLKETFHLGKWLKVIGNALIAAQKLLNCHLNQLKTDQFTAENAGEREEVKDSHAKTNSKSHSKKVAF